jgi:hypothetical protein
MVGTLIAIASASETSTTALNVPGNEGDFSLPVLMTALQDTLRASFGGAEEPLLRSSESCKKQRVLWANSCLTAIYLTVMETVSPLLHLFLSSQ